MSGRGSISEDQGGKGRSGGGRFLLLLLAAAAVLAIKSPDAWLRPQFWAEDGTIFFAQQYMEAWPQLLLTHAGYLHLLPRLVAWAGSALPMSLAPELYTLAAFLVVAATLAWATSRLRTGLALGILGGFALLPTNGEVFGTLTIVQWFIQIALLVAAFGGVSPPGRSAWLASLPIGVAALTGPFSSLIAAAHACALAGSALLPARATPASALRFDAPVHLPLYVGGAVQSLLSVTSQFSPLTDLSAAWLALSATPLHVFGDSIGALPISLWILVGVLVAGALASLRDSDGWVLLALIGVSVAQIALAGEKATGADPSLLHGDRYYVLVKLAFACSIAVLAETVRKGRWSVPIALAAVLGPLAVLNAGTLQRPALPASDWDDRVAALPPAASRCGEEIAIQPSGWTVVLRPTTGCPAALVVRPRLQGGMMDIGLQSIALHGDAVENGLFPDVRELRPRHLVPRRIWGTWNGADSGEGTIVLRTPRICGSIALPYITGPSNSGQWLQVEASSSAGDMRTFGRLLPPASSSHWSMLVVSAPPEHCQAYLFRVVDEGAGWGQWMAVGTPRAGQWQAWTSRDARHP